MGCQIKILAKIMYRPNLQISNLKWSYLHQKKILIIGPTAGLGGVRTHVEHLQSIFGNDAFKVKLVQGNSTLATFIEYLRFKPDVVIHNLSVYQKELLRIVLNRCILFLHSAKHILHLHGGRFHELGFLTHPIFKKMMAFHFKRYDRIFCLTEEQYATMLSLTKHKNTIRKIYNYVEIPDKSELVKEKNNLNLLFLGRLTVKKGVMDAVKAVKKIRNDNLRLWIVGEGELKGEILKNCDPRIRVEGKKNGAEKKEYLQKAAILILPSSWPEGLPYAMLEAAAYGAALIGTNVGSVGKILLNEVNGFFIEPGNINMLTDVIQKFLDNPELANKMGKESYRICKRLFSIEHLIKIYADLFIKWEFDIK